MTDEIRTIRTNLIHHIKNQNVHVIQEYLSELISNPSNMNWELIVMPEIVSQTHKKNNYEFQTEVPLLWTACETQNLEIVQLLIDTLQKSQFSLETFLNYQHKCTMKFFYWKTLLYHVCEIGCNLEIVKYILDKPELNTYLGLSEGKYGIQESPFCACVKNGHLELVKLFVELDPIFAHRECSELLVRDPIQDPYYFPLWIAATNNQFEIVKYLVDECGVNLDEVSGSLGYSSALGAAAHEKNLEIVRYLLKRGAKVGKDIVENTFNQSDRNHSRHDEKEFTIVKRGFPCDMNDEQVIEAKQFVRDQWEIMTIEENEMRNNLLKLIDFPNDREYDGVSPKPQLNDISIILLNSQQL